jgi:hypothetical protein
MATIDRAIAALTASQAAEASRLVGVFYLEARDHYMSYSGKWRRRLPSWLTAHGVEAAAVAQLQQAWAHAAQGDIPVDRQAAWRTVRTTSDRIRRQLDSGRADLGAASERLERLRGHWQILHDFCVEYIAAGLAYVVAEFGEETLADVVRFVLRGHVRRPVPPEVLLDRIASSMRGHLAGPGRRGSLQVSETDSGWTLTFAPCGSGGRLLRDYAANGEQAHLLRAPHDWAWGRTGVCHYCAHCCLGLTVLPIEERGTPVLSIDPPTIDLDTGLPRKAHCDFTIYRSPDLIPDHVYTDVGKQPPSARRATADG